MNGETEGNIVLASGGVDSAVTLAEASRNGNTIIVWFDYDQHTSERECESARALAEHYDSEFVELDLTDTFAEFQGGLTEETDLSDHYDEDGVATSYVPMRNTVFLSIAAGVAEDRGATDIWYGANLDDRRGYADCRDEYAETLQQALSLGTDRAEFQIRRPVIELEKPEIIQLGDELEVPFEHTWSCYSNGNEHCGECASCAERARGFNEAGVTDPCT